MAIPGIHPIKTAMFVEDIKKNRDDIIAGKYIDPSILEFVVAYERELEKNPDFNENRIVIQKTMSCGQHNYVQDVFTGMVLRKYRVVHGAKLHKKYLRHVMYGL